MTTESQYPQPKPSLAFRALLAALSKALYPVAGECSEDAAWELERTLSRWMMAKQAECIRRGKPTREDWAEQQWCQSQEEQDGAVS